MLQTRLWMGTLLVAPDRRHAGPRSAAAHRGIPSCSCLSLVCRWRRLWRLIRLAGGSRPAASALAGYVGVAVLLPANWPVAALLAAAAWRSIPRSLVLWHLCRLGAGGVRWEMAPSSDSASADSANGSVERMALHDLDWLTWACCPAFSPSLRWLYPASQPEHGSVGPGSGHLRAEVLRHRRVLHGPACWAGIRMTPVLSPKKTWEGAAGGLALGTLAAIGIDRLGAGALLRECLARSRLRPDASASPACWATWPSRCSSAIAGRRMPPRWCRASAACWTWSMR